MLNPYSQSNILFLLIIFSCTVFFSASVCADRTVIDISNNDWGLFRDFDAGWIDDDIYMPPVDLTSLPLNPPTCGWDALQDRIEKTVHLPATVEEHFWGDNGNTESVAGDWRGVSWWVLGLNRRARPSWGPAKLWLWFPPPHPAQAVPFPFLQAETLS